MTNYGTIPTSTAPGPATKSEYLNRAKERIQAGLGERRPWREFISFRSLGLPSGFRDATNRVKTNFAYFRMNYAIVMLLILFLSLLWHPISLIVFVVMMAVWLFLYFLRDEPLMIFRRTIDDRVVLFVLAVLTIVFLLLTHATLNILVALLIGVVVVLVHASFRKAEYVTLDEEGVEGTHGMYSGTSGGIASSSSA